MQDFVRRHSLSLTTTVLFVVSLVLMNASVTNREFAGGGASFVIGVLSPFDRLYKGGLQGIRNVWNRYIWLIGVEDERRELASRLKSLEAQNSQFIELQKENDRLRQLLNYREAHALKGVAATVTSRDASNWAQSISVDRGADDGIRLGQAVLDGNAIVGQVVAVSSRGAKVQLLTDNVSAIDALVQSSRAQGTVEGTLDNFVKLKYVARENAVNIGDRVIASGLDGVYPKGALIGVVLRVDRDTSGMFQSIDVEPSADVKRLENVLIVTGGEG